MLCSCFRPAEDIFFYQWFYLIHSPFFRIKVLQATLYKWIKFLDDKRDIRIN